MGNGSFKGKNEAVRQESHGSLRRRRVFRLNRSKLPLAIVAALLLYVSVSLGSRFDQIYTMQRDLKAMQTEIAQIKERNKGLREQLDKLQSDAYVEQEAREKLGLVKPGEARIVPVAPEQPAQRNNADPVILD